MVRLRHATTGALVAAALALAPVAGANASTGFVPRPDLHWPACLGTEQCVRMTHLMRGEPHNYNPPAGLNTFDTPRGAVTGTMRAGETTRSVVERLLGVTPHRAVASRHHAARHERVARHPSAAATPRHRATVAAEPHRAPAPMPSTASAKALESGRVVAALNAQNDELRTLTTKLVNANSELRKGFSAQILSLTHETRTLEKRFTELEQAQTAPLTPGMVWNHIASSARAMLAFVLVMAILTCGLAYKLLFAKPRARRPDRRAVVTEVTNFSSVGPQAPAAVRRTEKLPAEDQYVGGAIVCTIALEHLKEGAKAPRFVVPISGAREVLRGHEGARERTLTLLGRTSWQEDPIEVMYVTADGSPHYLKGSLSRVIGSAARHEDKPLPGECKPTRGDKVRAWLVANGVSIQNTDVPVVGEMRFISPSELKQAA